MTHGIILFQGIDHRGQQLRITDATGTNDEKTLCGGGILCTIGVESVRVATLPMK